MVLSLIVCCFLLVDRGLFCDSAQVYPGWAWLAYLLKGAFRGERSCLVVQSEPGGALGGLCGRKRSPCCGHLNSSSSPGHPSCREFEEWAVSSWVGMNGTSASFLPGETRLALPLREAELLSCQNQF